MKNGRVFILLGIVSAIIKYFSVQVGLFWDNVLFAGKMAQPLFENHILGWNNIPIESNPGHPPFLATYVALGWRIWGKSLLVTHGLMLPFVLGLLWQIWLFVSHFIKSKNEVLFAYLLVIVDPTLLAQLVLINPEVIQLFFFFLALNAILKNNIILKTKGLACLGIVTYRGMMLCAGLFLIDFFKHNWIEKKPIFQFFSKKTLLSYVLGALPAIFYLVWCFTTRGWIFSHPSENWGSAFGFSSVADFWTNFLKNLLVLLHRLIDFGRIILVILVIVLLYLKRYLLQEKAIQLLLLIAVCSTAIVYCTSLIIKNSMGHRYYIPSYLAIALLAFVLLQYTSYKKILYPVALFTLLAGHLIVYPDKIAQGWDASLAHLPYWKLRKAAIKYLEQQQIELLQVGTFFPNYTSIDNVELNGDKRSFSKFSGKEPYVFYSNVYNLTDAEFDKLYANYALLKQFRSGQIRVEIWQQKQKSSG